MRPWQHLAYQLAEPGQVLLVVLAIYIFFGVFVHLRIFGATEKLAKEWWLGSIAFTVFAVVGLSVGFLTGGSREPAIGATVPAILSLVGGAAVIFLNPDRGHPVIVASAILGLTLSLLLGTTYGSVNRERYYDNIAEYRLDQLYDVGVQYELAQQEAMIMQIRKDLGLDPKPIDPTKPGTD